MGLSHNVARTVLGFSRGRRKHSHYITANTLQLVEACRELEQQLNSQQHGSRRHAFPRRQLKSKKHQVKNRLIADKEAWLAEQARRSTTTDCRAAVMSFSAGSSTEPSTPSAKQHQQPRAFRTSTGHYCWTPMLRKDVGRNIIMTTSTSAARSGKPPSTASLTYLDHHHCQMAWSPLAAMIPQSVR